MKKKYMFWGYALIVCMLFTPQLVLGENATPLHPRNKRLVKLGLLKYPMFYPDMPRITAQEALSLYNSGMAVFILISYHNKDLIPGGIHLTEGQYPNINPNKLPLKKGQVLVLYCP